MRQQYFVTLAFVWMSLCFCACGSDVPPTPKKSTARSVFNPDSLAICELMKAQETAWNFGNLELFMKPYWKSDSLKFIGKSGLKLGWQTTLDNYKKSYPDKAAMGKLKFLNLHIELLDSANAYVIGHWQLNRTADTLAGHYSLLWKKLNNKWVIVADHSS